MTFPPLCQTRLTIPWVSWSLLWLIISWTLLFLVGLISHPPRQGPLKIHTHFLSDPNMWICAPWLWNGISSRLWSLLLIWHRPSWPAWFLLTCASSWCFPNKVNNLFLNFSLSIRASIPSALFLSDAPVQPLALTGSVLKCNWFAIEISVYCVYCYLFLLPCSGFSLSSNALLAIPITYPFSTFINPFGNG